eukprot:Gb_38681 [translate_table: standard]
MGSTGGIVESMPAMKAGEETIFSLVLSSSELAKLDLSNIQLFQADFVDDCGHRVYMTSNPTISSKLLNPVVSDNENANLDQQNVHGLDNNDSSSPQHDGENCSRSLTRQNSFSFCTSAENRNEQTGLLAGVSASVVLPVPVIFKSRGVVEAEKARRKQNLTNSRRKKAVSMDETSFTEFAEPQIKKTQDDSGVQDKLRSPRHKDRPPAMPTFSRKINGSDFNPEDSELKQIEGSHGQNDENPGLNPCIDLKSSPASKFLVQVMPWEVQPSPVTPFTPAAVPFKWEEVPGKPKSHHDAFQSAIPVLHLPPRLLPPPSTKRPHESPSKAIKSHEPGHEHHRRSSSDASSTEEKRVISIEAVSEEKPAEISPGSVLSSLDYKLPSPWSGSITPAYSPFRDLGPPEEPHWGPKASALISIWRKNTSKHKSTKATSTATNYSKKELFSGNPKLLSSNSSYSRELLMGGEQLDSTETATHHSLNARIAAAMGVKSHDCTIKTPNKTILYSWDHQPKYVQSISSSAYYMGNGNGSNLVEKRKKRKWVIRRLRRPSRFFKAFFRAIWRAVSLRKSRHRRRGNIKLSYQSLPH